MAKKSDNGLSLKEELFVAAYVDNYKFDAAKAYRAAFPGVADTSARTHGAIYRHKPHVDAAIRAAIKAMAGDKVSLAQRVVEEHQKIAFANPTDVLQKMNTHGLEIKSLEDIPEEVRPLIKSFKKTEHGLALEFYDKQKSLAELARILGMNDDNGQSFGGKYEDLVSQIRAIETVEKGQS